MSNSVVNSEHQYKHMVKGPHAHVHPVGLYWTVFGLLVTLTILTVYLAGFDFGTFSVLVTLLIAGTKACLVMAVFMHLWYDNKFYALVVSVSLVFLSLFVLFPILDFESRDMVDAQRGNFGPRDEAVFQYKQENPDALPLRPGLVKPEKDKLVFEEPHH